MCQDRIISSKQPAGSFDPHTTIVEYTECIFFLFSEAVPTVVVEIVQQRQMKTGSSQDWETRNNNEGKSRRLQNEAKYNIKARWSAVIV